MIKHVPRVFTISAIVLGLHSSTASAQSLPPVPSTIEVPAGHTLFFKAHAVGTQNYVCLPSPSGASWTFVGPQATLFFTLNGDPLQQLTTHFLSANPAENGTARATWQHSIDTSRVWARALRSSTDPDFVEAGAIPWLILEVLGTAAGPAGGSFLTPAVYIQRLNTSGGVAPSTGCTNIGSLTLVPYAADYFFYKKDRSR